MSNETIPTSNLLTNTQLCPFCIDQYVKFLRQIGLKMLGENNNLKALNGCDSFLLKVFAFIKIKGFKRLLFPFKNE